MGWVEITMVVALLSLTNLPFLGTDVFFVIFFSVECSLGADLGVRHPRT